MSSFCRLSDELIREVSGDDALVNQIFDKMPLEQKSEFTREVIKKGLAQLEKKEKPKKKKKNQEESESVVEQEMEAETITEQTN